MNFFKNFLANKLSTFLVFGFALMLLIQSQTSRAAVGASQDKPLAEQCLMKLKKALESSESLLKNHENTPFDNIVDDIKVRLSVKPADETRFYSINDRQSDAVHATGVVRSWNSDVEENLEGRLTAYKDKSEYINEIEITYSRVGKDGSKVSFSQFYETNDSCELTLIYSDLDEVSKIDEHSFLATNKHYSSTYGPSEKSTKIDIPENTSFNQPKLNSDLNPNVIENLENYEQKNKIMYSLNREFPSANLTLSPMAPITRINPVTGQSQTYPALMITMCSNGVKKSGLFLFAQDGTLAIQMFPFAEKVYQPKSNWEKVRVLAPMPPQ